MPKVAYIRKRFSPAVQAAIDQAGEIIDTYRAQGFVLTLRQLYYQFVSRDTFPSDRCWTWTGHKWARDPGGTKNAEPNYKWLGGIISDARLAGLIDWYSIEDRGRNLRANNHWDDPEGLITWAADGYGFNTWRDQPERVEVWVEKEALAGVIQIPSDEWDVPWFCCKGYVSQSELWRAAVRFLKYEHDRGQSTTIIYLGDHDPSGMDIDRAIRDSMYTFDVYGVTIERIALHMSQIEEYKPPPNPTKLTDARAKQYVPKYGYESWELDALEPRVLTDLINKEIRAHVDIDLLTAARDQQDAERDQIRGLVDHLE